MLLTPIPLQSLISSPIEREQTFLGSEGDTLVFKGNVFGEKREKLKLTYSKVSFTQTETILASFEAFLTSQPARLTFGSKKYILGSDGITEEWSNDTVTISINLLEA